MVTPPLLWAACSSAEGGTGLTLLVSVKSSRILPGAAESSRSTELIQQGPFCSATSQSQKSLMEMSSRARLYCPSYRDSFGQCTSNTGTMLLPIHTTSWLKHRGNWEKI